MLWSEYRTRNRVNPGWNPHSLRAVITAWLNASHGSRIGAGMNTSARGEVYNALSSLKD